MIVAVQWPAVGHQAEMLGALLMDAGFAGIEEQEKTIVAYVEAETFVGKNLMSRVQAVSKQLEIPFTIKELPEENWNARWEADFKPVEVGRSVYVRASFHSPRPEFTHDIVIDPKMSFGTGHHATTALMMQRMLMLRWEGKHILDLGCGTGVLAILAARLGAARVDAMDNEPWAFENAQENVVQNDCPQVHVHLGTLEQLEAKLPGAYDGILANINRQVLLKSAQPLRTRLRKDGPLLLSGILSTDRTLIIAAYRQAGFDLVWENAMDDWYCFHFE